MNTEAELPDIFEDPERAVQGGGLGTFWGDDELEIADQVWDKIAAEEEADQLRQPVRRQDPD